MSCVYYNEIDPYCVQWLRNLMAAGRIPNGHVDTRDICEVRADDLRGYDQAHFFAGIGGWPLALSLAGWPADRPVWTGSCPCQPFSVAGKRKGAADERHLWPEWFRIIRKCRPPTVFGEQVESAVRLGWLDRVLADLEGEDYACGAAVLGAHSVGAPHIRQRLWWVADDGYSERRTRDQSRSHEGRELLRQERQEGSVVAGECGQNGRLADAGSERVSAVSRGFGEASISPQGEARQRQRGGVDARSGGGLCGLGHANDARPQGRGERGDGAGERSAGQTSVAGGMGLANSGGRTTGQSAAQAPRYRRSIEPTGGADFWSDFNLIPCADGKTRRVEPGTFPLAHGVSARVGKLRAYGNAIVPQVAAAFVTAFTESRS